MTTDASTSLLADAPTITPEPVFYRIDGTRIRLSALRRMMPAHRAFLHWLGFKLRFPMMAATIDDVPVASLEPFETNQEALNPEVRTWFDSVIPELAALGFHSPAYHDLDDHLNKAGHAIATLAHTSLPIVARLRVRAWFANPKPQVTNYLEFITAFSDGTFLRTVPGKNVDGHDRCRVVEAAASSASDLLRSHREALAAQRSTSPALPASTQDEALAIGESLHQANRDHYLKLGILQPLSAADAQRRTALVAGYSAANDAQSKHHLVLGELEALIQKKTSWVGTVVLLAISLALFIALGIRGLSLLRVLALVPILFVHELGHYLAMKAFGYRNLRMFFIPGFGAAVTGRHFNVPGWKKAIVYLMGPLPGILIGIILGLCGILWNSPLLTQAALLTLLLNGSNLIPMLPFDGGHVVHILFFARFRWLDLAFRYLTAFAMFALASFAGLKFFYVIGGLVFIGALGAMHIGKVVAQLQREGVPTQSNDDHTIPAPIADRIIDKLVAVSKKPVPPKILASQTLQVFEALNTVPPRLLATVGLAATYLLALVAAIFFSVLVAFAQRGTVHDLIEAGRNRPTHSISTPLSYAASPASKSPTDCVLATFTTTDAAIASFDSARAAVQGEETVARFANTIAVRIPKGDETARARWVQTLQPLTPQLFVTSEAATASFTFQAHLRTRADAEVVDKELSDYFRLPFGQRFTAPWGRPLDPGTANARSTFSALRNAQESVWNDPEISAINDRIQAARRRGDLKEAKSLSTERNNLEQQIRLKLARAAAAKLPPGHDAAVVARFISILESTESGDFYLASGEKLGPLLGPAQLDDLTAAGYGFTQQVGPVLTIYTTFVDPIDGATALSQWLIDRGADRLWYDVDIEVDEDEIEEQPEDATKPPPADGT